MWDTKADSISCDAGALCCSETPLLSQKQCHISSPNPYVARVSSSHAWTMVSFMRSHSAVFMAESPAMSSRLLAGVHLLSRSLARQWGRRVEGTGVRLCGYGAGLLAAAVGGKGMGSWRALTSGTVRCLASFTSKSSCTPRGKWLCMSPLTVAVLTASIWVGVDEEGFEFGRRWRSM